MKTKATLNILSLAHWDYAGVGYQLSEAINQTTGNGSNAVRVTTSYIEYPYDRRAPKASVINTLWNSADVIHIHDAFPTLSKGLQDKPLVVTYHGSMYRRSWQKRNQMCINRNWHLTVSTVDLTLLSGKPLSWQPDTRFPYSVKDKHDKFTVCHAPTSRPGKSTQVVIDACKYANIPLELVEKTTWNECLEKKSRCHILVDQFRLGYGCNAIEAWGMGIPVIANADGEILQAMKSIFGYLPFMRSEENHEMLAETLVKMRDSGSELSHYATLGKAHFERYHSPEASAKIAIEHYHKAIELFYRRVPSGTIEGVKKATMGVPGRDGLILIRYIGGNVGTETYIGAVTGTKYEFSAASPLRYVDAKDVTHFLSLRNLSTRSRPPLFKEE